MDKLDIATEYIAKPSYMMDAVAAFKALADECTTLAQRVRYNLEVTEVPDSEPYPTAKAMFADIKVGRFKVSNVNCRHPQWTHRQNVDFRIVHDVLGHGMAESSFSWQGEIRAYQAQRRWHSQLACEALFTEVIGQTAVYSIDKVFPPQKVILLEERNDSIEFLRGQT